MGARQKLNQAFVNGSVLWAAVAGVLTQSWPVFWAALVLFLVVHWYFGGIRLRPSARREWILKNQRWVAQNGEEP